MGAEHKQSEFGGRYFAEDIRESLTKPQPCADNRGLISMMHQILLGWGDGTAGLRQLIAAVRKCANLYRGCEWIRE